MTRTRWPRRASKDVQPLSLAPALQGLGHTLGVHATPRVEFRIDLRQRLIEEARLIALQPKTGPPRRRPRRPKGGGIRLAAIGIGFSLAGGGVVAAAHSLSLPDRAGTSVTHGTTRPPAGPVQSAADRHAGSVGSTVATGRSDGAVTLLQASAPRAARSGGPVSLRSAVVPSPAVPQAVGSTLSLPSRLLPPPPSPIDVSGAPPVQAPDQHEPAWPTLLPTWPGPSPGVSLNPEVSPLR